MITQLIITEEYSKEDTLRAVRYLIKSDLTITSRDLSTLNLALLSTTINTRLIEPQITITYEVTGLNLNHRHIIVKNKVFRVTQK